MRIPAAKIAVVALTGLMAYQLLALTRDDRVTPLLPGDQIDLRSFDKSSRSVLETAQIPCLVLWVMDPACSACRRLAQEKGTWVASTPGCFWAFVGDDQDVGEFVRQYALNERQVLRLRPKKDKGAAFRSVRVVATPTRIVARRSDWVATEVRVLNAELLEEPARYDTMKCQATAE